MEASGSKIKRVLVPSRKRWRNSIETNSPNESDDFAVYLPNEIIDRIFTFLPIKSVVVSSFVAKPFRNTWLYTRNLCFDRDFAPFRRNKRLVSVVAVIHHVMRRHLGEKIYSFQLYIDPSIYWCVLMEWFEIVVSKGVEEFELDFSEAKEVYKLQSDLIDVETLRVLKLVCCELHLSPKLKGLQFLRSLSLSMVRVPPNFFRNLFSNCLLLESLALEGCSLIGKFTIEGLNRFRILLLRHCSDLILVTINTPSLSSFHYSGEINKIQFVDPMVIKPKDVIFDFGPTKGLQHIAERDDLMEVLRDVQTLSITNAVLEGLSPRYVGFEYKEPEFYLQNLKELQLVRRGLSFIDPWDILSFVKNCPKIERLFLDFGNYAMEAGFYWNLVAKEKFENCKTEFPELKLLKVKGYKNLELEEKLVNFFLLHAKSLESLIIVNSRKKNSHEPNVLESDFRFVKTISKVATVSIYGPYKDASLVFPKHRVLI